MFKEVLVIRRIFSIVDMITNKKFSNCPNVFNIGQGHVTMNIYNIC